MGGLLYGQKVGAHLVPLAEDETASREEPTDLCGIPVQDIFEHGDQNTHGVFAEHRAARDPGDEFGFGHGDGKPVILVDVHHHREIGAAVAHIDDVIVADAERCAQFLEDGDFAPTGRGADNGVDFAGVGIEAKARAENVIRRDDALERGLDDLLRSGGNDVERKLVAVRKARQGSREQSDVVFEADALTGFDQMLAADATESGVVKDEVRE